eukprot:10819702-Alexandrium_andersonii.AAC.1
MASRGMRRAPDDALRRATRPPELAGALLGHPPRALRAPRAGAPRGWLVPLRRRESAGDARSPAGHAGAGGKLRS